MIDIKKILLVLICLIPLPVFAISAKSYVVMDASSGRVLESKNRDTPMLIASTTKIMTALLAIENGSLEEEVEVSKEVLKSTGSNIYIEIGEKLTLKDLVYGLLLRSGNDAAIEIARVVGGSMEEFTTLMNEKAKSLGMEHTTFINSSGLENDKKEGNISTSYDMSILMKYALQNNTFREITGTESYTVKTNYKTYVWKNKNKLLKEYEYTIGGKTGFTKLARRTLVTAAEKEGKTLIVVTLNDPDDFSDHKTLYEKNFNKYNLEVVLRSSEFKEKYKGYYIEKDITMLLTNEELKKIKVNVNLEEENISIYLDDIIINKVSIFKEEEKKSENTKTKKWYSWLFFWRKND